MTGNKKIRWVDFKKILC